MKLPFDNQKLKFILRKTVNFVSFLDNIQRVDNFFNRKFDFNRNSQLFRKHQFSFKRMS